MRDDPYLLVDPYYGADFAAVDAFALELELPADDERRVEAGVLFELSFNLNHGHTFIPAEKLCAATAALLSLEPEIIRAGMTRLSEQERMVVDRVAGLEACYLPQFYEAEEYVCRRILQMTGELEAPSNLDSLVDRAEQSQSLTYAAQQREAIRMAAQRQLLIVTGGPGTGKTTVMSGILALYDQMKVKTLLAAPTGRAAKRLAECTGREASTIHRLLESQFDEETGMMSFFHDEDEPLPCDALIVDETSMVDLQLMTALLRALKPKCRLILVGDPDQLPSVGAGNLFADLIRSGRVETVRLTEIFRQASQSLIVMNAHAVNHGELPVLNRTDRDFFFLRRRDPEAVVQTIAQLCQTRLPKNMGIPATEIQVLSPTRKGETGTKNLNLALQAVLNPPAAGKKEKRYGDFSFREGDRVMQIRNNYDILWKNPNGLGAGTGIFNGDIGVIVQIDYETELVTVDFDDKRAEYAFDLLGELDALAESIRIHGIIQPLTVRLLPNGYYQIIAGERRWRAARLAGLSQVPVVVIEADDRKAMELALIENLQRADLNPIEEAEGYQQLISQYGMTQEQAAERVGKSRPTVANALRLLSLGPEILKLVEAGTISAGHARALLVLKTDGERMAVAQKVQNLSLSVRQTEALCKKMAKPPKEAPKEAPVAVDYVAECEKELKRTLGRGVRIVDGKRKGHIELEYYGQDDLQRLYEVLQSLSGRE